MKRKVCFVITSNIHYARNKLIIQELKNHPDIQLQLVLGASAILPMHGDVTDIMAKEGLPYDERIFMTLEGGNLVTMAKTTGLGIIEFTTVFDRLKPDVVVIRADRFEMLAAAVAAAYLNIPLAHIEGGDITGTIDESVRHAITKLSHIHFTTNEESRERVLRLGENPDYVFNFGSPELEFVAKNNFSVTNDLINYLGVGDTIDINKPYIIVMQHPVTTEVKDSRKQIDATLQAIKELNLPTIWFWPNVDAGTDEVSKGIRTFREYGHPHNIRFLKSLPAEQFIGLLKSSACLVGNSSAGIKEASLMGLPVVNIGTRQHGRRRGSNVIDVDHNKEQIKSAVLRQLEHGRYQPNNLYYQPGTAKNIVDKLASLKLYTQKHFHESR